MRSFEAYLRIFNSITALIWTYFSQLHAYKRDICAHLQTSLRTITNPICASLLAFVNVILLDFPSSSPHFELQTAANGLTIIERCGYNPSAQFREFSRAQSGGLAQTTRPSREQVTIQPAPRSPIPKVF